MESRCPKHNQNENIRYEPLPVEMLCVNIIYVYVYIYIYIYVCILYTSSVIGRMYSFNRSVARYWWSCTPSQSIGLFWFSFFYFFFFFRGGGGVRGSWVECHFLFLLPIESRSMINSLILGCLWPLVFVLNNILTLGTWRSAISHQDVFAPGPSFRISDSIWCHRTPLCHMSSYSTLIFCRGVSGCATDFPFSVWCRGLTTCLLRAGQPFVNRLLNNSWAVGLT